MSGLTAADAVDAAEAAAAETAEIAADDFALPVSTGTGGTLVVARFDCSASTSFGAVLFSAIVTAKKISVELLRVSRPIKTHKFSF